MWRNKHDFHFHRILSIADWLSAFGVIPLIIAAIYNSNDRVLLFSLAGVCATLLIISFFRASKDVWEKDMEKCNEEYKRDTTKLSFIREQKNNIAQYLHSRFSHLYLRSDQQVDIEVEWFNGTLFGLSFESVRDGVVKINDLQRKVASNDKRSCSSGRVCSYTITLQDKDIVELLSYS